MASRPALGSIIDGQPIRPIQYRVFALCALVAVLDGLDTQSIAIAAPRLAIELGLPTSSLGLVFSAAHLGAALGALTFGKIADRLGRKPVLIFACIIFGVFTLCTAHVDSLGMLLVVRLLAGVGLGGAAPCFLSLSSEYAPQRRRATVASLIWAAFPLGGTLGAFLNAYLIAHFGWQSVFHVGGLLPILTAGVLAVTLPESISFLAERQPSASRTRRLALALLGTSGDDVRSFADQSSPGTPPARFADVVAEGRRAATLSIWASFFLIYGTLTVVTMWTPVILTGEGIAVGTAGAMLGLFGAGALIGSALSGRLVEALGAPPVLIAAFLGAASIILVIGQTTNDVAVLRACFVIAGFFCGMSASGLVGYAAVIYPAHVRSTGLGMAVGIGRAGQVVFPLVIAMVIAIGFHGGDLFTLAALAAVLGACSIAALALIGRKGRGRDQAMPVIATRD